MKRAACLIMLFLASTARLTAGTRDNTPPPQLVVTKATPDLALGRIIIEGEKFGNNIAEVFMGNEGGVLDSLNIVSWSDREIEALLNTTLPGTYLLLVTRGPAATQVFAMDVTLGRSLRSFRCEPGQAVVGFDETGNPICAEVGPPPPPPGCDDQCFQAFDQVLAECLANGGDPLICESEAFANLDACLQSCSPPPPQPTCEDGCFGEADRLLTECVGGGGELHTCDQEVQPFLAACLQGCRPCEQQCDEQFAQDTILCNEQFGQSEVRCREEFDACLLGGEDPAFCEQSYIACIHPAEQEFRLCVQPAEESFLQCLGACN